MMWQLKKFIGYKCVTVPENTAFSSLRIHANLNRTRTYTLPTNHLGDGLGLLLSQGSGLAVHPGESVGVGDEAGTDIGDHLLRLKTNDKCKFYHVSLDMLASHFCADC